MLESFVASLQEKRELQATFFPVNITKILRTTFFYRTPLVAASKVSAVWKDERRFCNAEFGLDRVFGKKKIRLRKNVHL